MLAMAASAPEVDQVVEIAKSALITTGNNSGKAAKVAGVAQMVSTSPSALAPPILLGNLQATPTAVATESEE